MLDAFGYNLGVIAGIIVSLGIIGSLLYNAPKIYTKFKIIIGKIAWFFIPPIIKDIRTTQLEWHEGYIKANEKQKTLNETLLVEGKGRDEKLDRIVKAMWNGGKDGMIHQVGRLAASHRINFENAPLPQFECDVNGNNSNVNEAYRKLAQVWSVDDLTGTRWRQVAYGDLLDSYIEGFKISSLACEDFIGDVDVHNPINGQHRGRWKIHASAVSIGDTCIYFGRFIMALDETAENLVKENGWDVVVKGD